MNRLSFLLLLILFLPLPCFAAALEYTITGLDGNLRNNALAWLGDPPDTAPERPNFVASARERVDKSLQALGHYAARITLQVEREQPVWKVRIHVEPGEPVRIDQIDLQLDGDASDDETFVTLLANPGFTSGDVLHHGHFEKFRSRLLSTAQQRGYFDARIAQSRIAVDKLRYTADITVVLDSGPRFTFGRFIYDADLVSESLLGKLSTFAPGDNYDQSALQDFQTQLQNTGFFASVVADPQRELATGTQIPIAVSLLPAKRHSFDAGIGYSTDTEAHVSLRWRTPRVNRFGHSQQTRFIYSQVNPSGRLTYNIPLTHPLNDLLQLWARAEENEFGDLDSDQYEIGVRRELRNQRLVTGYSIRTLRESWTVLDENRSNDYVLVGGSISHSRLRGSLVDPSGGLSQLYTLEATDRQLGSDVGLIRATGLLRYVVSPFDRHRIVTRAELGFAEVTSGRRGDLAPSLNFFAGGNQSIRGFGYQSIGNTVQLQRSNGVDTNVVVGGDRLAVLSFEYQYYVSDRWRGAVFADGGDAFDAGEFDWKYGAGFGLHYLSAVGAVRVEFARNISEDDPEWRLHLNIGAEF